MYLTAFVYVTQLELIANDVSNILLELINIINTPLVEYYNNTSIFLQWEDRYGEDTKHIFTTALEFWV